jgi:hypothetical protein
LLQVWIGWFSKKDFKLAKKRLSDWADFSERRSIFYPTHVCHGQFPHVPGGLKLYKGLSKNAFFELLDRFIFRVVDFGRPRAIG